MARSTEYSELVLGMQETINCLRNEEVAAVFEMLKTRRSALAAEAVRVIAVGTLVEFDATRGRVIRGTVTKINQKTVNITPESESPFSRGWRVSAGALRVVAV